MAADELVAVSEEHFRALIEGRIDDVIDRYRATEDTYVFVEGPRWSTRGHERITTGWRAYGSAPFRVEGMRWIEGPFSGQSEGMGWVAGICELDVGLGGERRPVRLRGSHVLRRDADGEWRIEHEHFSQPAADPYGTGDWLPSRPLAAAEAPSPGAARHPLPQGERVGDGSPEGRLTPAES